MTIVESEEESGHEVEPEAVSFIADPVFADTVEVEYDHPVCGPPTNDPNRYTVHVPFHNTVLSLGKENSRWIHDDGITGKTKEHIHFEVFDGEKTLVSLGGPATASVLGNFQGDKIATVKSKGFTMITEGNSWMEAKEQVALLSVKANVILRSAGPSAEEAKVGIQSDVGPVMIFGGEKVLLGSPAAVKIGSHPDLTPQNIGYEAKWAETWSENLGAKIGSTLDTLEELVTSGAAIAAAMRPGVKSGKPGESGWHSGPLASRGKQVADILLFLSTGVRGAMELAGVEPHGSIGITGQKFISLTAGIGATMYGTAASAVVSLGQAELLGGVSALVKGLVWTEIAGTLLTAVTAIKNVEIAASTGEIGMTAKKEIAISSLDSEVLIGAEKDAQITSIKEHVFVHGHEGAYVGGGPAAGYAAEFKEDVLKLGKVGSANKFKSPAFDNDCLIEMKTEAVMVKRGKSMLRLKDDGALLKGPKVNLHAESQNVQINGEKILIG